MLIIRQLVIFITLTLLPPFIIEFIFFWPPTDTVTGIGSYLLILSFWAAIITFFSRVFGFDLDSLFVRDTTDQQTVSDMNAEIEKMLPETEVPSVFIEPDGPIRNLIMALLPTSDKPALAKLTLYSDSENSSNEISLNGGCVIQIGRHPTLNDVVIVHPTISRKHARIITEKNGFYIEDHSSNGTRVNTKQLSHLDKYKLNDGDIVYFGPVAYRFELQGKMAEDSLEDTDLPPAVQPDMLSGLSVS